MLLRGVPVRRSFTTKLILLSLVFASFIFYIKFINTDPASVASTNEIHYNNRKLIAGKLVSEYNGDVDASNGDFQPMPVAVTNYRTINAVNQKYEQLISIDLAKQVRGLGDNGKSATLTDPTAKQTGERQLAKIALNEELSEQLSYNRTLQDARNPLCRTEHYNIDSLPTTSVIIIFYNEPYSVLVRTVHSVLNTVDHRLLKEIILVDDSSTNVELKGKLDYYVKTRLPRNVIKIIRLDHR